MPTEHNVIADPNIHEPKGVAAAAVDKVYQSDGAGSGAWGFVDFTLVHEIDDISTVSSSWIVSPYAGTIIKIYSVIDGVMATGDTTLSFELAGVAITNGDIVITQSGSAAGDVDSSSPTALNVITVGQVIEIITDGGSTNTVKSTITIVIDRT